MRTSLHGRDANLNSQKTDAVLPPLILPSINQQDNTTTKYVGSVLVEGESQSFQALKGKTYYFKLTSQGRSTNTRADIDIMREKRSDDLVMMEAWLSKSIQYGHPGCPVDASSTSHSLLHVGRQSLSRSAMGTDLYLSLHCRQVCHVSVSHRLVSARRDHVLGVSTRAPTQRVGGPAATVNTQSHTHATANNSALSSDPADDKPWSMASELIGPGRPSARTVVHRKLAMLRADDQLMGAFMASVNATRARQRRDVREARVAMLGARADLGGDTVGVGVGTMTVKHAEQPDQPARGDSDDADVYSVAGGVARGSISLIHPPAGAGAGLLAPLAARAGASSGSEGEGDPAPDSRVGSAMSARAGSHPDTHSGPSADMLMRLSSSAVYGLSCADKAERAKQHNSSIEERQRLQREQQMEMLRQHEAAVTRRREAHEAQARQQQELYAAALHEHRQRGWLVLLVFSLAMRAVQAQALKLGEIQSRRRTTVGAVMLVQRFIRQALVKRKHARAIQRALRLKALVSMLTAAVAATKRDRAADVLKTVLRQRQGQQGTDTLSTAIRRYRHRVVRIQRAWRGMLAVRRAKLALWRMQWDAYVHKHGVGADVPSEIVTGILASEYKREHRAAAAAIDSYSTHMADFKAARSRGHPAAGVLGGAGVGGAPPARPRVRVRLGGSWIRAAAETVSASVSQPPAAASGGSGHAHASGQGRRGVRGSVELHRRPSIGAVLSRRTSVASSGPGLGRRSSVGTQLHYARRSSGVPPRDDHKK